MRSAQSPLANRHTAALALACALVLPARAEFIQPVDVWVSNGEGLKDLLIDGGGFDDSTVGSPESNHARDTGQMWSAIGTIKAEVVCDLGQTVDLTKIYIWNFNGINTTDVGMKDVEVLVSPDSSMTNGNFTAIALIALKEGGETGQVFNVTATDVRLVKLRGLSNWGQGYTVGLAEVRFESGTVAGKVPSIVFNTPREGDVIDAKADTIIPLKATITDKDADLGKVEFYDGATKLGEKGSAPFTWNVKAPAVGEHAYRIVANDRAGHVAWSTVNVSVRELVADRIIQIDDTADIGTSTNQIRYFGTWNLAQGTATDPRFNHNDHYESNNNRNDYFEVRFVGVKIDVYATVASHHGTAKATIDGGTEYIINYKAAQRAEQVHVWSSPILPQREHVLRVRVVGDGVVTADRFDVSVSDKPEDKFIIQRVAPTFTDLLVYLEDVGLSIVNPATALLYLDSQIVGGSPVKSGTTTTLSNHLATPFLPGSVHTVRVVAKDTKGTTVTNDAPFTLPKPEFPLTGLGERPSSAGAWSFRQAWNAGRADAVVTAVEIALRAAAPGFAGVSYDTDVAVINFGLGGGAAGYMPDDLPFPAENFGLPQEDFVCVGQATVVVPTSGDWTIGVHTDDGFALRFIGAPFDSVTGVGARNDDFPEYIAVPNPTGDSNTRGVLKDLAAGRYTIEFISYQRSGGAGAEIYAAPGAFENDGDTDQWQLIGSPDGWQIVSNTPLSARTVSKTGERLTIEFTTPQPDATHQLLATADFKAWTAVASAVFEKLDAATVRVTVNNVSGNMRFYRLALP
jgi:hypothetical protein